MIHTLTEDKKKFENKFTNYQSNDLCEVWYFIESLVRQALKETEVEEKKILYPQNSCKKDCEKCRIEIENWNKVCRLQKQKIKQYLGEVK
jgi:hypothetical protein